MSTRFFAVLFLAVFLIGTVPMLLLQLTGSANAGLAAGFMLPIAETYQVVALIAVGVLAAWLGREAIITLPLCTLLMLAIGGMMQIDDHIFPAVRSFIAGAIILFSLGVSMLRNKMHLMTVLPIALWVYFAGAHYLSYIPSITTPLYCLLGSMVSVTLLISIGVSLGITLTDGIHNGMEKLKSVRGVATFLSLF